MENKEEIVCKLLCMSCLCVGRQLHRITDQRLQQFYLNALKEIPLCNPVQVTPYVCWECIALLRKVVSFREQVKDSYRILQTYNTENLQEYILSDVPRPPRFKTHHNEVISITPDTPTANEEKGGESNCQSDNVKNESQNQVQSVYVKEEEEAEWNGGYVGLDQGAVSDGHISDISNLGEIETEIKKLIRKKKKKKCKKTIQTKLKKAKKIVKRLNTEKVQKRSKVCDQKIISIEMSYEEMLAEREREATKESYVKAEYKCESCLIGFTYSKSYKAHVAAKHASELGDYSCPVCKTIISSVESFTAHYKRHMKRYECAICHKRTMDIKVMQQHYYSTHEITLKEYKCNLCGKISNSIDTHRYHKDTHKARVQCSECDKTFSHRAGLMNHRLSVHEFHNEFPCPACNKVFRWKTSLKRHLLKHDAKEQQQGAAAFCPPCGVSFSSVSSYQRHLKNSLKHVTQHELKFICDHCNRRFADKTKLRDHIEEKHLHKTFHCHICLKPSKNRVGLDQHIRNVHKGRPNNKMCHHCGKGFPTKVQLESHIRSHTGERPFICEFCPTTFSLQSNLYKHNRQVHLNIKSKRYPLTKKRKEEKPPDADILPQPLEQFNHTNLNTSHTNTHTNQRTVVSLHYSPERGFVM